MGPPSLDGRLRLQNPVLFMQILDDLLLLALEPADGETR
jgi:uncharacterized membrane protein